MEKFIQILERCKERLYLYYGNEKHGETHSISSYDEDVYDENSWDEIIDSFAKNFEENDVDEARDMVSEWLEQYHSR